MLTAKAPEHISVLAPLPSPPKEFKGKIVLKKIDWDLIQVIVLVSTLPVMLIIGALLPSFFANYS